MTEPELCIVTGEDSAVTACLIGQILSARGKTGLLALTGRYDGTVDAMLRRLGRENCRHAVLALPEGLRWEDCPAAETGVILTGGRGEAVREVLNRCRTAVLNLDDPDGIPEIGERVRRYTYSERRNEADVTAENLRLLPFHTEFEAVTGNAICRVRVPLSEGRGLYPGLAAVTAGLSFGIPISQCARRMHASEPESGGMISLPGHPYATVGYFEQETERIREI